MQADAAAIRQHSIFIKLNEPGAARTVGLLVPWLVIAATPGLFAAATWDNRGAADVMLAATRLFAVPVLVAELVVILVALLRQWRPLADLRGLPRAALPLICALLAVQVYTAAVAAPKPVTALIYSYSTVLQVLFGFAVAHLARCSATIEERAAWPLIIAGTTAYCAMLTIFAKGPHPAGFDWQYLGLGVSNVRQLGYYAAVGSASSFGCALLADKWKRALFLGTAALSLALAAWSGSRGGILAILIGFIVGIVLTRRSGAVRAAGEAILVACVGTAVSFIAAPPQHVYGVGRMIGSTAAGTADISSGRSDLWRGAWHAIQDRPLLGHGEGQFGWIVPLQNAVYLHPHNVILQLLFQWGVIGTAIFVALAVMLAGACVRAFRARRAGALPAVMVLASLGTLSLYDGALFHAYPVMMVVFSLATLIGFARGRSRSALANARA